MEGHSGMTTGEQWSSTPYSRGANNCGAGRQLSSKTAVQQIEKPMIHHPTDLTTAYEFSTMASLIYSDATAPKSANIDEFACFDSYGSTSARARKAKAIG